MKKIVSICMLIVMLISLLSSCGVKNTNSSTDTKTNTETSTDSNTETNTDTSSDTETNTNTDTNENVNIDENPDSGDAENDNTADSSIKVEYDTEREASDNEFPFDNMVIERYGYDIVSAGRYYGDDFDNIKYYGSYYRIIDNYNDFSELTAWGNKIDELVFEDNFVLVLYTYKNHDVYYSLPEFYHLHDRGHFDDFGNDKDTKMLKIIESWSVDIATPAYGPQPPHFYDYEIIIPTEKHEIIYLLIPKTELKDEISINGEIELEIMIWQSE